MKRLFGGILLLALSQSLLAQQVYQIRADSVRIYNVCDTAELILENRTQKVSGFLFNKGNGRTEFQRLKLISPGAGILSIQGQDTIDLQQMMAPWGDGRYDLSSTNFVTFPYTTSWRWEQWPANKVIGYDAYQSPDMPRLSEQAFQGKGVQGLFYNGLVVRDHDSGFDMAVNWDGELQGPNGAFLRVKDDTQTKWSNWRELLFKDYSDSNYIRNQKATPQNANLWISGKAKVEDSVMFGKYRNNAAEDSVLSTDALGNLKLKKSAGTNIYNSDGTLTGDRSIDGGNYNFDISGAKGIFLTANGGSGMNNLTLSTGPFMGLHSFFDVATFDDKTEMRFILQRSIGTFEAMHIISSMDSSFRWNTKKRASVSGSGPEMTYKSGRLILNADGGLSPLEIPNATLQLNGSLSLKVITTTNDLTLDNGYYINVNNLSNVTITLPSATNLEGRTYFIKKISNNANPVLVLPSGSALIDGAPNYQLKAYNEGLKIYTDGTNWFIEK